VNAVPEGIVPGGENIGELPGFRGRLASFISGTRNWFGQSLSTFRPVNCVFLQNM
jgi:hypothetical protein